MKIHLSMQNRIYPRGSGLPYKPTCDYEHQFRTGNVTACCNVTVEVSLQRLYRCSQTYLYCLKELIAEMSVTFWLALQKFLVGSIVSKYYFFFKLKNYYFLIRKSKSYLFVGVSMQQQIIRLISNPLKPTVIVEHFKSTGSNFASEIASEREKCLSRSNYIHEGEKVFT